MRSAALTLLVGLVAGCASLDAPSWDEMSESERVGFCEAQRIQERSYNRSFRASKVAIQQNLKRCAEAGF